MSTDQEQNSMRVRHIKRGTEYVTLGQGRLQTDKPLADDAELIAYRGEDGGLWFRPPDEFHDGRFVELASVDATPRDAELTRLRAELSDIKTLLADLRVRVAELEGGLGKIMRGTEAVLLDAALNGEPVSRDVVLLILNDARAALHPPAPEESGT